MSKVRDKQYSAISQNAETQALADVDIRFFTLPPNFNVRKTTITGFLGTPMAVAHFQYDSALPVEHVLDQARQLGQKIFQAVVRGIDLEGKYDQSQLLAIPDAPPGACDMPASALPGAAAFPASDVRSGRDFVLGVVSGVVGVLYLQLIALADAGSIFHWGLGAPALHAAVLQLLQLWIQRP